MVLISLLCTGGKLVSHTGEGTRHRVFENRVLRKNVGLRGMRAMNVGPCHHAMARPRVADGGTASNMEGSCE